MNLRKVESIYKIVHYLAIFMAGLNAFNNYIKVNYDAMWGWLSTAVWVMISFMNLKKHENCRDNFNDLCNYLIDKFNLDMERLK